MWLKSNEITIHEKKAGHFTEKISTFTCGYSRLLNAYTEKSWRPLTKVKNIKAEANISSITAALSPQVHAPPRGCIRGGGDFFPEPSLKAGFF